MPEIDDRVVSMTFESTKFQAGVSATLSSLDKLNAAIKNIGASGDGFANIEKSANKVNFLGIGTALDKLKAKFGQGVPEADQAFSDVEKSSSKVGFLGISGAWDKLKSKFGFGLPEADQAFSDVEKGSSKVQFLGIGTAFDKLKSKFGRGIPEAADAFSEVENASNKTQLTGASGAVDKLRGQFGRGFPEAVDAFSGIEQASGKVEFRGLSAAIDGISNKFSILEGAAAVALGNITTKAIIAGKNQTKALTVAPIMEGFREYELKLSSIQTILSNTKASGATLKDVGNTLNELNEYADKTIYNFGQMTKNIGTFTAAGVDLETATGSIKGIANLAALSGSNSQQASTAMYQLSQAISAGRVSLQDWNSVVNAGMGGTIFQRALAQTAVAMGEIDESALKLTGKMKNVTIEGESFRNSVMAKPGEESWLTGKVLTNTLRQLSGDLTDAQLKAQGFSDAQIKAIQSQAKMAVNAATQVKSLTQLLDTTKESIVSGWAETWEIVFGDFKEAKTLFTNISNAIGGFVSKMSEARNSVLHDWKELGGRTSLISGIGNVFEALFAIIKPIKNAFRDIFPAKTGQDLYELTRRFTAFTQTLKIGPETAENLKRVFKGFFAVLDIGKEIVSGIFTVVKILFGELGKGSGGLLAFAGGLGDMLVAARDWLKEGDRLHQFFVDLGNVLATPIRKLGEFADVLSSLFEGVTGTSTREVSEAMASFNEAAEPMEKVVSGLKVAWEGFLTVVKKIGDLLQPALQGVFEVFADLGDMITDALAKNNFDTVFDFIQTGLLGGIFLAIKKAFADGFNINFGQNIADSITDSLGTIQNSLKTMQTNVRADSIFKIAAAMALLAVSAVAISMVPASKLTQSMSAMAVGLGQLLGALAILSKLGGFAIFAPIIGAGLVLIAGAMALLVVPIMTLSLLDWDALAKGLLGVHFGLGALIKTAAPLAAVGTKLLAAGPGIFIIAGAMVLLAGAMKIFGTMDWEDLGKGLVAVAFGLNAIAVGTKGMGPQLLLIGPALIAVAFSMDLLAGAMKIFATMSWEEIAKGIVSMAGALMVLAPGLTAMALALPGAVALPIAAFGLSLLAPALALFGNMSWGTIGKGLVTIGAALGILAVGLTAMALTLPGSLGLLAAAGALAILAPTLGILGNLRWGTIIKGLASIAISLGVIGGLGMVVGPGMVALGLGLAALGLGVLAIGKGLDLMSKAVVRLGSDGGKGVAVFMASLVAAIAIIPKVIIEFIKGIVSVVGEIVKLAPTIVEALAKIVVMLLDVVIKAAPKFAEAMGALIMGLVRVINENSGPLISAGFKLLMNLLHGIEQNIGKITNTVGNIIVKFMTALTSKMPQLVQAGAKLLVAFIKGITNKIGDIVGAVGELIAQFLSAIANNLGKIIRAGGRIVIKFIEGISKNFGDVANAGADAVVKFADGLGRNFGKITNAAVDLVRKLLTETGKALLKMARAGADAVLEFIHGVADAIREYDDKFVAAGADLGAALIQAIVTGLVGLPLALIDHLVSPVKGALQAAKDFIAGTEIKPAKGLNNPNKVGGGDAKTSSVRAGQSYGPFLSMFSDTTRAFLNDPEVQAASKNLVKTIRTNFTNELFFESKEMQHAGSFLVNGFLKGLTGSPSEINSAMSEMNSRVSAAVQTFKSKVKAAEQKLEELGHSNAIDALTKKIEEEPKSKNVDEWKKARKKFRDEAENNKQAIAKYNTVLKENGKLLYYAEAAHNRLNDRLQQGKSSLLALSKVYDKVNEDLEEAKAKLEELQQVQTEFTNQFSTLPTIEPESDDPLEYLLGAPDRVDKYTRSLETQIEELKKFKIILAELRALGLDDATYKKLLDGGTDTLTFAEQLLAGGATAVDGINELDRQLTEEAAGLAKTATEELYEGGVAAAEGLVEGLKSRKKQIADAMADIAKIMRDELKKVLKMRSPSRVFAELGKLSMDGLAQGLGDPSAVVASMRSSMDEVSAALAKGIDFDPTITPILDLSQVRSEAKKLDILNTASITAATSYGQAASISAAQAGSTISDDISESFGAKTFKFEQTLNSPTALSETEIYRQTNNLLSQAKSVLGLP